MIVVIDNKTNETEGGLRRPISRVSNFRHFLLVHLPLARLLSCL